MTGATAVRTRAPGRGGMTACYALPRSRRREGAGGAWQVRLQQLPCADPALAAELQRVLDQVLTPALTPAGQARVRTIIMTGSSHDSSTFTQIGAQVNCRRP